MTVTMVDRAETRGHSRRVDDRICAGSAGRCCRGESLHGLCSGSSRLVFALRNVNVHGKFPRIFAKPTVSSQRLSHGRCESTLPSVWEDAVCPSAFSARPEPAPASGARGCRRCAGPVAAFIGCGGVLCMAVVEHRLVQPRADPQLAQWTQRVRVLRLCPACRWRGRCFGPGGVSRAMPRVATATRTGPQASAGLT